jgi:general secretion pathway protein K
VTRGSLHVRWTEAGSAMAVAALTAALLATTAGLLLIETRTARAASGESTRFAVAEHEAERLLALAVVRLDSGERLPAQGVLFTTEEGARVLRQDASGLVDANAASPERLAALLVGVGASTERAAELADRIADWRDEDNLRRVNGAESADYVQGGLSPPGNRRFETEGELSAVMGMTPELLRCVLPYLTTYSGQAEIDAAAAPPQLAALLGLQPAERAQAEAPLGRVVALIAEAPISNEAAIRRTLWLRLTGDPAGPVLTHRAQQELAPRETTTHPCGPAP